MITDEALMLAVADGDMEAFDTLVRRHQQAAWSTAFRFLRNEDDARDIVQSAFIKLLEAAPRYRPTAALKTFLTCIVTRLCLDWVEKKRPVAMAVLPETADPSPSQERAMLDDGLAAAVRGALSALGASQRMALILRHYEELSYAQIGEAMDLSPKAVERLLARGRLALREAMEKAGGGGFLPLTRL
jgi:RNA polymerase sigma-70 factor (ECF subfamily)